MSKTAATNKLTVNRTCELLGNNSDRCIKVARLIGIDHPLPSWYEACHAIKEEFNLADDPEAMLLHIAATLR